MNFSLLLFTLLPAVFLLTMTSARAQNTEPGENTLPTTVANSSPPNFAPSPDPEVRKTRGFFEGAMTLMDLVERFYMRRDPQMSYFEKEESSRSRFEQRVYFLRKVWIRLDEMKRSAPRELRGPIANLSNRMAILIQELGVIAARWQDRSNNESFYAQVQLAARRAARDGREILTKAGTDSYLSTAEARAGYLDAILMGLEGLYAMDEHETDMARRVFYVDLYNVRSQMMRALGDDMNRRRDAFLSSSVRQTWQSLTNNLATYPDHTGSSDFQDTLLTRMGNQRDFVVRAAETLTMVRTTILNEGQVHAPTELQCRDIFGLGLGST